MTRIKGSVPVRRDVDVATLNQNVGYDGVDNDATQGSTWSWTKTAPGTDTVINDPDGLR
mgnify:CR=1 FL=1